MTYKCTYETYCPCINKRSTYKLVCKKKNIHSLKEQKKELNFLLKEFVENLYDSFSNLIVSTNYFNIIKNKNLSTYIIY